MCIATLSNLFPASHRYLIDNQVKMSKKIRGNTQPQEAVRKSFWKTLRGCPSVHKRRPQSGEKVCSVRTFCGQGGFFRCRRPHFFVQKTSDFSKFVSARTRWRGGWATVDIFRTRAKWDQSFAILCGWVVLSIWKNVTEIMKLLSFLLGNSETISFPQQQPISQRSIVKASQLFQSCRALE